MMVISMVRSVRVINIIIDFQENVKLRNEKIQVQSIPFAESP